jgi:hypothetical protein
LTIWDTDPSHAAVTAQEWLDYSEKAGMDPFASVAVERIGDEPTDADLLGTLDDVPPTHPGRTASYDGTKPTWCEPALVRLMSLVRRLFVRGQSSSTDT